MNSEHQHNNPDCHDMPDRQHDPQQECSENDRKPEGDVEREGQHPREDESTPPPDEDEVMAERVDQDIDEALRTLRDERDELEQRLLRTAADYQNYVKRAQQNVESAREQQLIDMAKSLVAVLDHFDRALEVDPQQTTTDDLLEGVRMVRQELLGTLRRFGIDRIEPQPGEPFDPNCHEAMMREKRDDVQTDHVTQQFQPGYILLDKVIRPAKVGVAE